MSPLSGADTLDKVIGYCQNNGLSTVDVNTIPGLDCYSGKVVRVGNIVFRFSGHSTGNDVNGWIVADGEVYHFMNVPYWFSSRYTFNSSRWEKGAWDLAVDSAIVELRKLMDEHRTRTARSTEEATQARERAERQRKARFEAQFV